MNSFFSIDNPIFQFLGRMFDVMYLNILCVICCIPIVTIGSSITALYYCMLKIHRERDSSIGKMFFHSLKTNLKQGIVLTIFFIGAAIFLIMDIQICKAIELPGVKILTLFLYIIVLIFMAMASYVFPLLAQFDNTIINILKNSLLLAVSNLRYTCVIIILNAIPIVLFLWIPELFFLSLPLWFIFGVAIIAMLNSKMFVKVFDKYISEE